ncbi:MAG: cytochrome c3 family protein [Gammaproteobacteria bacterium]|nr:cytochrome c3 family protein [Gammaproteobacteria bacterium]
MDILLREIRNRPDGRAEYIDTEISGEVFSIGSAPDCALQLLGEGLGARHADIRSGRLECIGKHRVVRNGEAVAKAKLAVGDTLEFGGHRLTLIEAPAGFDLALELIRDDEVDASAYEAAFQTDLEQTWLGKRRPAWILLLVVVALAFAVPFGLRFGEVDVPVAALTDLTWSSGPLLPAHQLAIGDECSTCHVKAFESVRDDTCQTCHDALADHFHASLDVPGAVSRCAACHREHNEPGSLVVTADSLCTDCHREALPASGAGVVDVVTGFDEGSHPSFDAHLLKSVARVAGTGFFYDWKFEVTPVAGAQEASNLKFPHDVHLDAEKVQSTSTSQALVCRDCHTLSADQEHFQPITMEQHCRSCHDLRFDDTDPERELPHGEPLEAILAIEGHFLKKYSDPDAYRAERAKRRLPDREVVDERCTGAPYVCATRKTLAESINQFTVRGCVTCHAVEDNGNQDVYSRFQVLPIRLAADYFPGARFDHFSHMTQKDARGDAACMTCHQADRATTSAELLIPDIDNCVQCHADTQSSDRVVLGCIDCHTYHPGQALTALREMDSL